MVWSCMRLLPEQEVGQGVTASPVIGMHSSSNAHSSAAVMARASSCSYHL